MYVCTRVCEFCIHLYVNILLIQENKKERHDSQTESAAQVNVHDVIVI